MSPQQGIDIVPFLDEQSQTLNLSPVSRRVDGVLARETDGSPRCDWDESPQYSTKFGKRESGVLNFGGQNTKTEGEKKKPEKKTGHCEKRSFYCNLSFGPVMGLQNSGKQ